MKILKKVQSWSKPNIPNLIGRKEVDWSIFRHATTTIPIEFYEDFEQANDNYSLRLDETKEIELVYEGKIYSAKMRYVKRKGSTKGALQLMFQNNKNFIELIQKELSLSYDYIFEYLELDQWVKIPEEYTTYIDFYQTNIPFRYEVRFINHPINDIVGETVRTFSDQELIHHIYSYIKSKGFYFEEDQIKNLYLSLKTKGFVILSGISGTGKTQIVRLFAESIGANVDNKQFMQIPVRPDWSDSSDLIGYVDLSGRFNPGPLTEFLMEANKEENRNKPYILLLDEMNLARVEYYFSDLLSIMETKKIENGQVLSDPIVDRHEIGKLMLLDNVFIVGTVNMDETTHQFSKKVLDRANTIEYNDVKLDYFGFLEDTEPIDPISINNVQLSGKFLSLKDAFSEYQSLIEDVSRELIYINKILSSIQAQIAYRVRDEICFYMIYNEESNLLDKNTAFDFQLMQKILPRIMGNDLATKQALENLFEYCTSHKWNDQLIIDNLLNEARFPRSARKIHTMLSKLDKEGFTSFWFN